jgi:hypothetical protein
MGPKELVNKVDKNVLHMIGDRPALEYFRKYIGDYDVFMNYCLAVFERDHDSFYVRSAPSSDPDKGTVILNGRVSEGAMVQIGTADKDGIVKSCADSLSRAPACYPGGRPAGALLFSCFMFHGTTFITLLFGEAGKG